MLLFVLFNRDMMINLYKLYFQPYKKSFPSVCFSTLPIKHKWGKIKSFLSSHFSILPTKWTLTLVWPFSIFCWEYLSFIKPQFFHFAILFLDSSRYLHYCKTWSEIKLGHKITIIFLKFKSKEGTTESDFGDLTIS